MTSSHGHDAKNSLAFGSANDSRPWRSGWEKPSFFADNLKKGLILFRAVLGEIFDESAYARFIARNRLVRSRASYAAFLREHELIKARRPRCC